MQGCAVIKYLLLTLYFCKAVVLLGQALSLSWHKESSLWAEFSFWASEGPLGLNCPVCVLARGRFLLLLHSLALAKVRVTSLKYSLL